MNLSGSFGKRSFVRPVHRRQAACVQLILHVALGPNAELDLVFTHSGSRCKEEEAIEQRLDNKREAAAANDLTVPRLKTKSNTISGRREIKTEDPSAPPLPRSSDITDV